MTQKAENQPQEQKAGSQPEPGSASKKSVADKTKILVAKHKRNQRNTGETLNASQLMVMGNVASCFNRCATFPYINNQQAEISDTIANIKTGLGKDHKEDAELLRVKMHEIAEIINKIK